jgi:hypothetical protein
LLETLGLARVPRLVGDVINNNNNEIEWSPLRQHLHDEKAERLRASLVDVEVAES